MRHSMSKTRSSRRGAAMLEFTLAGIASLMLLVSVIQLAIGMWNYHTLAQATHETTRYASTHGKGCWIPGNTCTITVGDIATRFKNTAIGVPADKVQITLVTDSGAQTVCDPLNSCLTNATVWPPSTNKDYNPGKSITVQAVYNYRTALALVWPGAVRDNIGNVTLPSVSTQRIQF